MAKTGGKVTTWERFDCDRMCTDRGEWSDERRALLGCRRVDLTPPGGTVDPRQIHRGGWMGRLPIVPSSAPPKVKINPARPTEDPDDGCPGAWYRGRFVASVLPYMRRRDEHGGRVSNHLLDRCDDDLVALAVAYAEDEQERFQSWRAEVIYD